MKRQHTMRTVLVSLAVLAVAFCAAPQALGDQVALDYSYSDRLSLDENGAPVTVVESRNSGTTDVWWSEPARGSVGQRDANDQYPDFEARRWLVKWDLSSIVNALNPGESIQVNSARVRLSIQAKSAAYGVVRLNEVTSDSATGDLNWNQSDITGNVDWTTAGGDFTQWGSGIWQNVTYGDYRTKDFNLDTDTVASWFNDANLGLMLTGYESIGAGETSQAWVLVSACSSVDTTWDTMSGWQDLNTRPVLLVDYDVVPEPATMGLLAMGGLGMLLRRKRK